MPETHIAPSIRPKEAVAQRVRTAGQWQKVAAFSIQLVALVGTLLHAGCGGTGGTLPRALAAPTPGALAPGDSVKITFSGAPDLNQVQRIRADGKLSLPRIGQVQAAGKRMGDFQDEITRRYKTELQDNEVVVSLESSSVPIYVTGAVTRPGKVVLDRPMTVFDALMEAGGASNLGNLHKVVLVRSGNGHHYSEKFDLSKPLKGGTADAFYVRAYDTIYVPEKFY